MNCKRGHPLPSGARFCPTCGEDVATTQSAADVPNAVVAPSTRPLAATQRWFHTGNAVVVILILIWGVLAWYPTTGSVMKAIRIVISAALGELLIALLIVWLIRAIVSKRHSFGLFLIIWAILIPVHFAVVRNTQSAPLAPEPSQSGTANDQAIATAKATAIAQQVMTGRKIVDQQTHDLFWSLIRSSGVSTPEASRELVSGMAGSVRVQNEFWKSMRLSAHAHRVLTTQEFDDAMKEVSNKYPDISAPQEHQKAMLQAAATGVPFNMPNGKGTIVFTEHYAEHVLATLDVTNAQVDKLYDPAWHP